MTLDQLRVLVAVVETGSFSAAGRRLGRVQSAVSQAIQNLEQSLGVTLLHRATKAVTLTDAGRALLLQARQVLQEAGALRAQATAMQAGMEPELTVAVDNLLPSPPLLASLRALRARFPDMPVTLHTAPIFGAERRLREAAADIALCGLRPGEANDLVATPLTSIAMSPVAAPSHPLALAREKLTREMMSRHVQLVLTDPSSPAAAPSIGVLSAKVWRFVDLGWRLDFVLAGFGWCNMPAHLIAPAVAARTLTVLDLLEPSLLPRVIPIFAVHMRARPPGPAGRWFLDRLAESFAA